MKTTKAVQTSTLALYQVRLLQEQLTSRTLLPAEHRRFAIGVLRKGVDDLTELTLDEASRVWHAVERYNKH